MHEETSWGPTPRSTRCFDHVAAGYRVVDLKAVGWQLYSLLVAPTVKTDTIAQWEARAFYSKAATRHLNAGGTS